MRFVPSVDDGAFESGFKTHFRLHKVGALTDLKSRVTPVLTNTDPTRASDDLAGNKKRCQATHDGSERHITTHQIVLVRTVGSTLVICVVLVQVDGKSTRDGIGSLHRREHHVLSGLFPDNCVEWVGHFWCGVLRMGMVNIEAGTVSQDHVQQAWIFIGALKGFAKGGWQVHTACIVKGAFLFEIPPRSRAL